MQQNHVSINEQGILEIHVVGEQTAELVQDAVEQARVVATDLRAARKPVLLVANILLMTNMPTEACKLTVDSIKNFDFDKFTILGAGTLRRFASDLMLQASCRGTRVKYFDEEDKCVAWLLDDEQQL